MYQQTPVSAHVTAATTAPRVTAANTSRDRFNIETSRVAVFKCRRNVTLAQPKSLNRNPDFAEEKIEGFEARKAKGFSEN